MALPLAAAAIPAALSIYDQIAGKRAPKRKKEQKKADKLALAQYERDSAINKAEAENALKNQPLKFETDRILQEIKKAEAEALAKNQPVSADIQAAKLALEKMKADSALGRQPSLDEIDDLKVKLQKADATSALENQGLKDALQKSIYEVSQARVDLEKESIPLEKRKIELTGEHNERVGTLGEQKQTLIGDILAGLKGEGQYSDLFNKSDEYFNKYFVDPAKARFKNQIAPGIQEKYAASGQQGTDMEGALLRAGVDLNQNLNEYRYAYDQDKDKNRQEWMKNTLNMDYGTPGFGGGYNSGYSPTGFDTTLSQGAQNPGQPQGSNLQPSPEYKPGGLQPPNFSGGGIKDPGGSPAPINQDALTDAIKAILGGGNKPSNDVGNTPTGFKRDWQTWNNGQSPNLNRSY